MNRRLSAITRSFRRNARPIVAVLAGLTLVLVTGGCASSRPAGVLVQHQLLASSTQRPDQELRLKVVTYNIWGLPSWMTGARRGRYPGIAAELERLDPDIILLQEAWTAKARTAAPDRGRWALARPAGQHTFFQQSGLVTLSKFPISDGQFYPFSRAAFPDRFVNKGILKVSVQLPGGRKLNVWNAHLQDGGPAGVRRSQVRELVARVRAAHDGQMADLVGGDFNSTPDSEFFGELALAFGPPVQGDSANPSFITFDGLSAKPGAGETLDYIFVRPTSGTELVESAERVAFTAPSVQQRLSDHFGIEAALHLRAAPGGEEAATLFGDWVMSPVASIAEKPETDGN